MVLFYVIGSIVVKMFSTRVDRFDSGHSGPTYRLSLSYLIIENELGCIDVALLNVRARDQATSKFISN